MYSVYVEVKEGSRYVTRLCLGSLSAERLIKGAKREFLDAAKFLEGCIRADRENKELKHEDNI
jgi:hypothetical protein